MMMPADDLFSSDMYIVDVLSFLFVSIILIKLLRICLD